MLVYRFRLISEDHDNLIRDIDILPGQTFFDFHVIIMESTELTHCEQASFYLTDKKYKKDKEITLKSVKRQIRKYDEDLDEIVSQTVVPPLMKKAKLKNFIEDPHQKMIYEFQGNEFYSFHIELFKILQADNSWSFPQCVKKNGELPKKAEILPPIATDTATPPKGIQPKIQIPKPQEIAKPNKIEEDEVELAEIGIQLGELLAEEAPLIATQVVSSEEEESYDKEEEEMEHIEDYDDLDNLESKYSGYDRDSDDY